MRPLASLPLSLSLSLTTDKSKRETPPRSRQPAMHAAKQPGTSRTHAVVPPPRALDRGRQRARLHFGRNCCDRPLKKKTTTTTTRRLVWFGWLVGGGSIPANQKPGANTNAHAHATRRAHAPRYLANDQQQQQALVAVQFAGNKREFHQCITAVRQQQGRAAAPHRGAQTTE